MQNPKRKLDDLTDDSSLKKNKNEEEPNNSEVVQFQSSEPLVSSSEEEDLVKLAEQCLDQYVPEEFPSSEEEKDVSRFTLHNFKEMSKLYKKIESYTNTRCLTILDKICLNDFAKDAFLQFLAINNHLVKSTVWSGTALSEVASNLLTPAEIMNLVDRSDLKDVIDPGYSFQSAILFQKKAANFCSYDSLMARRLQDITFSLGDVECAGLCNLNFREATREEEKSGLVLLGWIIVPMSIFQHLKTRSTHHRIFFFLVLNLLAPLRDPLSLRSVQFTKKQWLDMRSINHLSTAFEWQETPVDFVELFENFRKNFSIKGRDQPIEVFNKDLFHEDLELVKLLKDHGKYPKEVKYLGMDVKGEDVIFII